MQWLLTCILIFGSGIISLLLVWIMTQIDAVDKGLFKKCDDSSFCRWDMQSIYLCVQIQHNFRQIMWPATSAGNFVVAMATHHKPSYIGLESVTLRRGGKNTKCNPTSRITWVVDFCEISWDEVLQVNHTAAILGRLVKRKKILFRLLLFHLTIHQGNAFYA